MSTEIYVGEYLSRFPNPHISLLHTTDQLRTAHPYERLLTVSEHCQRINQIARKQTQGSTIDWEDAAQIAQLKVLQSLRNGKFRHGSTTEFYRWARTVARFEIIDLVRKEKSRFCTSLNIAVFRIKGYSY